VVVDSDTATAGASGFSPRSASASAKPAIPTKPVTRMVVDARN
jgi:hypothetical protein